MQYGVYASKWPGKYGTSPACLADVACARSGPLADATLWTIVNRRGQNLTGVQLQLVLATATVAPGPSKLHYYDCYHGSELLLGADALAFDMEAGGFGCVVELTFPADPALLGHLAVMQNTTRRHLASFADGWSVLPQRLVPLPRTRTQRQAPPGMVRIPRANFTFTVSGVEIEGTDAVGVDVQYPWEHAPQRKHKQILDLGPFFIDKSPVTCRNYTTYLAATGYRPEESFNWLTNWKDSRTAPSALLDVPVTYISMDEATLFCAWAHGGSRLPHSYEWQYAAQGLDGRQYPWGNTNNQSCYPMLRTGTKIPGAEQVGLRGAMCDSPFGVSDLVGNVWQYTDTFEDAHTRAAVLRGSSNYRPGQGWYFPAALKLDQHNKYAFCLSFVAASLEEVSVRRVVDEHQSILSESQSRLRWVVFILVLHTAFGGSCVCVCARACVRACVCVCVCVCVCGKAPHVASLTHAPPINGLGTFSWMTRTNEVARLAFVASLMQRLGRTILAMCCLSGVCSCVCVYVCGGGGWVLGPHNNRLVCLPEWCGV